MASHPDRRTPVVVLAGFPGPATTGVDHVARMLRDAPGTVVIRHDLTELREGIVRRTVWSEGREQISVHELAHGCVSCTLRADLLPLLCLLAARDSVRRIVIALDPAFEAEAVGHAVDHVPVAGVVGRVDGPAGRDVRIEAVLTCLDARTWLPDALCGDTLAERGLADADDDRTIAQVAVGQVDFADAAVVFGVDGVTVHEREQLGAVLERLIPQAPVAWLGDPRLLSAGEVEDLLHRVPADSRRGRIFDAHAPLLRGQPPLTAESGVALVEFATNRPFHPARLHQALDALFDGVITARGRIWLATQPDEVVWLESAGGGLRVGSAGRWLAAMDAAELAEADSDRRALAGLRWDDRFGDRDISLAILTCDADVDEIRHALHWALVDEAELLLVRTAPELVAQWDDPFGSWHEDPCDTSEPSASPVGEQRANER
ncbi:ribosome hibernation factor-recruiting GTPase MRF [Nocardia pseudobrasiliensis]|uniref:G3E family GTPase n=1 Tax=Nocardia pseudobrasiliensis TaxID=45979 RepID=A0A370I7E6_9NOCA|nr:GTP-binding protein [Nocardia pseudobrasiliensis]RDI66656.1 G3E family GTPase [Nocardia pseudobrasiliensis]